MPLRITKIKRQPKPPPFGGRWLHSMSKKEKEDKNTFMNLMTDFAFKHMFVTLPDAKKTWEQCKSQQEQIIYLIKTMHLMDKESVAYNSGEFEDLFNEAELENMAAEDIVEYRNSILIEMERQSELEFKKEEGIELGREEEKFDIARKMRQGGMATGDIMLYTGLSEKQISDL